MHPAITKDSLQINDQPYTSQSSNPTSWQDPFIHWLKHYTIPTDVTHEKTFRMKASRFILIRDVLFKMSIAGPYIRCLGHDKIEKTLRNIHGGEYGNHTRGRSLAHKTITMGYFWATIKKYSIAIAKKCDSCQRFASISHNPCEELQPILSPWPFMKWGKDIVGPLPQALG